MPAMRSTLAKALGTNWRTYDENGNPIDQAPFAGWSDTQKAESLGWVGPNTPPKIIYDIGFEGEQSNPHPESEQERAGRPHFDSAGNFFYYDVGEENKDPWYIGAIVPAGIAGIGALSGGFGLSELFKTSGITSPSLSLSSNVVSPGDLIMEYDPETGLELGFNDTGQLISSSGGGQTTYYNPITPTEDSSIFTGADPTAAPNPIADTHYMPGAANPTIATQLGSVAETIAKAPLSLLSKALAIFSPAGRSQTPVYNSRGEIIGYRAGITGGINAVGNPSIAPAGSTPRYDSRGQLTGYSNPSMNFTGWLVGGVTLIMLLFILAIGRR